MLRTVGIILVMLMVLYALIIAISVISQWIQKRARGVSTFEDFYAYFSGKQVDKQVCLAVYRCLQVFMYISDFPVHPNDRLDVVYGISDEGVNEIIEDISDHLKIIAPNEEECFRIESQVGAINNVEDLVEFFSKLLEARAGRVPDY